MKFYAYMVTCADQSIYTGHADNLEARLAAHNDGRFRGFTFTRRPVRLIFQTSFPTRQEAIEAERQIKGWSRAKKLALAEGDWELLERLSLRRQPQKRSQCESTDPPFMVREPHHEREATIF
ncbi:MAG: GIY-YIG nuclease family protein [Chloroflexi bacterium]|nr:MAG: GIY-YIG nuclease family protein [Chloroflexota bacterium]TMG06849.1 MAG: GIY-YIG nuclease family protein [Chloroflexota bacterium]